MSAGRLDWLLKEFTDATPGVVQVLVVSADGLRLATSPGMAETTGDQLSAVSSGLVSLARGAANLLHSGPVTQTILEMGRGYLFVSAIDQTATLAVHADRTGDMGIIGYEMTMLATRVGHVLAPGLRAEAPA